MLVFVDTTYGSTFYIELNLNDKVLDIKYKIENSQGIPVSMQTLYYKGEPLLVDDLDLNTCNIFANSRLLLVLPYQQDNNDQVLQPTSEQSLAPVQDSLGEFQDWSAMGRSISREMLDQREQSTMARHDKNQDLLQSEPSSTSNTFREDLPFPTELFSNNGSHWPASTTEKSINSSNVFHTEKYTIPSNTFDEGPPLPTELFSNMQSHWPESTTDNSSNLFHTEQSTILSNTYGEDLSFTTEILSNIETHWPSSTTDNSNVFHTEQPTIPSKSLQDLLGQFQDWTAMARSIFRQMLDQLEQSLVPSNAVEALGNQVWSGMMASTAEGNVSIQESSGRHHKNQESTSNTFGDLSFGEDPPLSTEHFSNIRSHWPASTTEKSIDNSNVFPTEQSTVPSNTFGDLMFGEDPPLAKEFFSNIGIHWPVSTTEDIFINKEQVFHAEQPDRVLSSNQVVQSEKSPLVKEVINIPDSPVKNVRKFRKPPQRLRVMILPHSPDNKPVSKVPVSVAANENVEELRKELEKLRERNELKLPEEGYFFIHKQNVLEDDKSFLWNGVAQGDTIEIFPGYVTKDGGTFGL